MENLDDNSWGALLGVFIGDAAGATLEFRTTVSESDARHAITMPGGGVLKVAPGQITDDSELTLALYHILRLHSPQRLSSVILDDIANSYVQWFASLPFDIGNTCNRAFSPGFFHKNNCSTFLSDDEYKLSNVLMESSANTNMQSEANGALMRIVPMAIWSRGLPDDDIACNARADARLSHPHTITQDCNAVYCIILAYLLNNVGDYLGAYDKGIEYAKQYCCSTTVDWMMETLSDDFLEKIDCSILEGHVRYAFCMAMYFLQRNTPFEDAIVSTLRKGGDTDTNSAIVGGIMGALHGASKIPPDMYRPLFDFDCSHPGNVGHMRPLAYSIPFHFRYECNASK